MKKLLLALLLLCAPAYAQQTNNILTGQNFSAPMTNTDQQSGYSFRNSTLSDVDVYGAIYSGVTTNDGVQSVINVPSTATVIGANAVGAYFKNSSAATNAVGLFSTGKCVVNSSRCWAANHLLMDSDTRNAGTGTGRVLIGDELDFNVTNPATQVIGMSLGGNSVVQSNNAVAVIGNTLGNSNRWQTFLYAMDGAVSDYGLALGPPLTTGTSIASLKIIQQYLNGASAKKTLTQQATNSSFVLSNDDTGMQLVVRGSAPALSVCGTSPSIVGTDTSGTVTVGTGSPTSCTLTFAAVWGAAPHCTVSWRANLAVMQYSVSVSAVMFVQTAASSNKIDYICTGS